MPSPYDFLGGGQLPQRAEDAYQTSLDRWGQIGQFAKMLAVGDPNQTRRVPVDALGQPLPIGDPNYKDWLVGQANEMSAAALTGGIPMAAKGAIGATGGALKIPPQAAPVFAPRIENPIRAYHGSPHDFDKFDLSKIGTGEGAQAYGHGLYFAENPAVAQSYKAANNPFYLGIDRVNAVKELLQQTGGDKSAAIAIANQRMLDTKKYSEGKLWQDVINNFDQLAINSPGRMYEVNIHARPEQMLNWDAPLTGQSPSVATSLNRLGMVDEPNAFYGEQLYRRLGDQLGGKEPTSVALRDAGIPGIKYLDQGSRVDPTELATWRAAVKDYAATGNPKLAAAEKRLAQLENEAGRTSNYVIFTPEIIDIVKKYGWAGLAALSTIDPSTLPIPQGQAPVMANAGT